jgi:hypothetical protein
VPRHLSAIGAFLAVLALAVGCGGSSDRALVKGAAEAMEALRGTASGGEARSALSALEAGGASTNRLIGAVLGDVRVKDAADELLPSTGCAALQHIRDTNQLPTVDDWVAYIHDALVSAALRVSDAATDNALFAAILEAFKADAVSDDGIIYRQTVDSLYADWSCGRTATATATG